MWFDLTDVLGTAIARLLSSATPMQVSLDLLKKSGDETGLAFTGYSESYEDGLDCVAIFDGMSWTLQLLSGALKVQ